MTRTIAIDAHPRGADGLLADAPFLGRTILAVLADQAARLGPGPIVVHAPEDGWERLRRATPGERFAFDPGLAPADPGTLRTDRLYDERRLRRAFRAGLSLETAVIWRLDRPDALRHAADEVVRRRTYQPLGRYWAWPPARSLARLLAPTSVRPNHLTLLAGLVMLAAAAIVAVPVAGPWSPALAASLLALGLILDTADGHLARLQGTASPFGKWLDAVLDEAADMALHAAIAWSAFAATSRPGWLVAGMAYAMGKYVFRVAVAEAPTAVTPSATADGAAHSPSPLRTLIHYAGHADVRWHAWIVLALVGGLRWELVAFAAYYPLRAAGSLARGAFRHA